MAQSQTTLDLALRHIEQNHKNWDLTKEDIADIVVSDSHISNVSGSAHIYFQQRYEGISIDNAILNVSISSKGKVLYTGKQFIPQIVDKVNTTTPSIDAETALVAGINFLELTVPTTFTTTANRHNEVVFEKGPFSSRDVAVKMIYVKDDQGNLVLAYDMAFDEPGNLDYWRLHVDATTGAIIGEINLLLTCTHGSGFGHKHTSSCNDQVAAKVVKDIPVKEALASTNSVVTNSYRVFALPTEAPIYGPHEIVINPEDLEASPLGWHDNGNNQWTITRGNNIHAFMDTDADGTPDQPEPDGGATLDFDFPFDPSLEPIEVVDAATVNLFYMSNAIHDFSYLYGFDEAAGNFQDNNFGNGGAGNDHLNMHAQYGSTTGSLNNAFYQNAPDGSSPTVAMFVWDLDNGSGLVTVTEPSSIAGTYLTGVADFGPAVTTTPICGEVAIANDGIYDPYFTDGCEETYVNGDEVDGKIVIIDRGGCWFEQKAVYAEAYGAIAVIICNFEDEPMGMAGVPDFDDPSIPTVSLGSTDCQTIRQFAGNGLEICLVQPVNNGPDLTDGDLDNGIIAHEYGHGITIRMTGGASNSGCLGNAEQMGEGWSDFFGLVATVEEGDTGEMPRGIGNYAVKLPVTGKGIRRYPYSTDMNISPLTYGDVALNTGVHAIGEVWCNMIWDLYWAMTDEHGWDADLLHGTGGNNMAIALVMEGVKTQQCFPGFVSGRDAILAADEALYNGENQCLIWEVFARRGCGFYADEGDTASAGDQIEDFEPLPTCIPELKISKVVTPLINPGENIEVTLKVINHKPETLTNVVVTDDLVDGLSFVDGSESANVSSVTINGNQVSLVLGDMAFEDELLITYSLATTTDIYSIRKEYDDAEYDIAGSIAWWVANPIAGTNQFDLSEDNPNTGDQSWFIPDVETESQHQLIATQSFTIDGDRPVIRFFSDYDTEAGADGGLFEISTDGGTTYQQLGDDMIRNGYPGGIQYATFVIPNLGAFSGNSNGYKATYVDLSDYAGQDVTFRFHFATDDNTFADGGWYIDDFEYMDMENYNTTTCAASDQGDLVCTEAAEEGTIIESQLPSSTYNPEASVQLGVFPNPANDVINVTIASKEAQNINLSLVTLDGKEVMSSSIGTTQHTQTFPLNVANLPAGFYFVKAATNNNVIVEKVVIK